MLASDAAHIHSPAGVLGANTGIQDAYNLGWKLGLVCAGQASAELLETYHEERHEVARQLMAANRSATALLVPSGRRWMRATRRLPPPLQASPRTPASGRSNGTPAATT